MSIEINHITAGNNNEWCWCDCAKIFGGIFCDECYIECNRCSRCECACEETGEE